MPQIERHVDIEAMPEAVFDLICDLHGYHQWLPSVGDYEGTSEISPPPVAVGTTYVEHSARGIRHGVVIGLDRPRMVAFRQPMTLRPSVAGTIDSTVIMSVEPRGDGSLVTRTVEIGLPRRLDVVRSVVVRRYARESERMLNALKAFAER
jgi:carbon monoxide dehydrogenase subunit G